MHPAVYLCHFLKFYKFVCLENNFIHSIRRVHELSSPALTLESWVRIPLKAWMLVCVYSVFVSPIQGVLPTVLGLRN
jgi:hypothetical protein